MLEHSKIYSPFSGSFFTLRIAHRYAIFLKEIERLRSRARHNEAAALDHARREGYREADEKWQNVVAEKDAEIAELRAKLQKMNNPW